MEIFVGLVVSIIIFVLSLAFRLSAEAQKTLVLSGLVYLSIISIFSLISKKEKRNNA